MTQYCITDDRFWDLLLGTSKKPYAGIYAEVNLVFAPPPTLTEGRLPKLTERALADIGSQLRARVNFYCFVVNFAPILFPLKNFRYEFKHGIA